MYPRDPISKLPLIGGSRKEKYNKLGIETIEDLLRFRPRAYLDFREPLTVEEALKKSRGERVAVFAKVEKTSISRTANRGIFVVSSKIKDESGEIGAVWFNQKYLKSFLQEGREFLFYGPLGFDYQNRKIILLSPKILPERSLYIIYPQTAGLTSRQISSSVKAALRNNYRLEEYLPDFVIKDFDLLNLQDAVEKMHFPVCVEDFEMASKRFDFEDLFNFICQNEILNKTKSDKKAMKAVAEKTELSKIIKSLPYELTEDQAESLREILEDLGANHPMNRLLQGDVGSGKTIVALICAYFVIKNNYQVIFLAPTEILADQHFATAKEFFSKYNFTVELVTGNTKGENLNADLIIGTHAVLNCPFDFSRLGLVIIDEQHRFGVEQRARLIEEGNAHLLSLSATPIPRTIGHLLFGNLAVSQIKTKPHGRKKVKTFVIPAEKKNDTYLFVDKLIAKGQRVFVVCPLIESQEKTETLFDFDEVKSIEKQLKELQETCLGLRRIGSLNGRMKQKEKEDVMRKFRSGEIDVLVSTSVVEVGIDVPDATVMIVEGADRFGLAQLHQFRGRVGRNQMQSYCFLFVQNLTSENTFERMKAFVANDDGFKLSKIDLKLRGAGALFGMEQSGFGGFNPRWLEDEDRLEKVSDSARQVVASLDKYPLFEKKLTDQISISHLE